MEYDVGMVRT